MAKQLGKQKYALPGLQNTTYMVDVHQDKLMIRYVFYKVDPVVKSSIKKNVIFGGVSRDKGKNSSISFEF